MTRTDPLTPEQLEPVARALALSRGWYYAELSSNAQERFSGEARAAITAAIDAGLVVRAEEREEARARADRLEGEAERLREAADVLIRKSRQLTSTLRCGNRSDTNRPGGEVEQLERAAQALLSQPEREDPKPYPKPGPPRYKESEVCLKCGRDLSNRALVACPKGGTCDRFVPSDKQEASDG